MSNTLVVQNNNTGVDVKRISSREVAEMMEVQHPHLLSKTDKITKTLTNQKIDALKYWIEGTYKDKKGEQRREYLVSKEGCEFLAHKSTGEKGILFTHRYMERFKEMEQIIDQQTQMINKQYEDRLDRLESMVTTMVKSFNEVVEKLVTTAKVVEQPKSEQISFINTPLRTPYTATKIGKQINRKPEIINKVAASHGIITKTNNGWVLNKKYEEAGYGKTCNDGQWKGTFVRYSEKGAQEIKKIFNK